MQKLQAMLREALTQGCRVLTLTEGQTVQVELAKGTAPGPGWEKFGTVDVPWLQGLYQQILPAFELEKLRGGAPAQGILMAPQAGKVSFIAEARPRKKLRFYFTAEGERLCQQHWDLLQQIATLPPEPAVHLPLPPLPPLPPPPVTSQPSVPSAMSEASASALPPLSPLPLPPLPPSVPPPAPSSATKTGPASALPNPAPMDLFAFDSTPALDVAVPPLPPPKLARSPYSSETPSSSGLFVNLGAHDRSSPPSEPQVSAPQSSNSQSSEQQSSLNLIPQFALPDSAFHEASVLPPSPSKDVHASAESTSPPSAPSMFAPLSTPDAVPSGAPVTTEDLLRRLSESGVSDLFLGTGQHPYFRVAGEMQKGRAEDVDAAQALLQTLVTDLPSTKKELWEEARAASFLWQGPEGGRYRVRLFCEHAGPAAVIRRISEQLPKVEDLSLPPGILELCQAKAGLILVSGAAGSGRTRTALALLEYINANYAKHVVTLEDAVEWVLTPKRSLIQQFEFAANHGLTESIRRMTKLGPDVIFIAEWASEPMAHALLRVAVSTSLVILVTLGSSKDPQILHGDEAFRFLSGLT